MSLPAKFHFIWVGATIPKKYFLQIIELQKIAAKSGIEINIWTDKKTTITKAFEKLDLQQDIDIPKLSHLKIREIQDLVPKMESAPFYQEENRLRRFFHIVNRETVGLKNLAAVSDLLRAEILRQEGGYYFDTDTNFLLKKDSQIKVDDPPSGFRCDHGVDMKEERSFGGNDIIASMPNHEILYNLINTILDNYENLDNEKIPPKIDFYYDLPYKNVPGLSQNIQDKIRDERTQMDAKRNVAKPEHPFKRQNRKNISIHAAGPGALGKAMIEYVKKRKLSPAMIESLTFKNLSEGIRSGRLQSREIMVIANILCESKSDQTWLLKSKPKSFDDAHLIKGFGKPAPALKSKLPVIPTYPLNMQTFSQGPLIDRMKALNYPADSDGVCFGLAHMGMQAFLAGDIELFERRLALMNSIPLNHFAETIELLQKKRALLTTLVKKNIGRHSPAYIQKRIEEKFNENFTQDERLLLEIPAFFEGLAIHQNPNDFSVLYGGEKKRQDAENSLPLTLSKKLEAVAGIEKVDHFTGMYDVFDVHDLLQSLIKVTPVDASPIVLNLNNINHNISLCYNPAKKSFKVINANVMPSQEFNATNLSFLSSLITRCFSKNNTIVIHTSVYGVASDTKKNKEIVSNWKNNIAFIGANEVTPQKINGVDSNNINWLILAAREKDYETAKKLLVANADPNKLDSAGFSTFLVTMVNQDIEMLKAILAVGTNPNTILPNNNTPLVMATISANLTMVKKLLAANADPDMASPAGLKPLEVAELRKYSEIQNFLNMAIECKKRMKEENDKTSFRYFALKKCLENLLDKENSASAQKLFQKFLALDDLAQQLKDVTKSYRPQSFFHAENPARQEQVKNLNDMIEASYMNYINGAKAVELTKYLEEYIALSSEETKKDHLAQGIPGISRFLTSSRLATKLDKTLDRARNKPPRKS